MTCDTLLFEIGAEELPAGYIPPALDALAQLLADKLTAARIDHGAMETLGTPRRLAIMIQDVALKQADQTRQIWGPPAKVALDENGQYTLPARKFAEKNGLSVKALQVVETDKGAYLRASKVEKGRSTPAVLKQLLPQIIEALPFPKTMRWADRGEYFARPVFSLTTLLGTRAIAFTWAGLTSNRYTHGHPFMAPGRIKLSHPNEYVARLKSAWVWVDPAERRQAVIQEINAAARKMDGRVLPDPELETIVTNMVECPVASAGRFDEKFLQLPQAVLITAMRSHQRYFAVVDDNQCLKSCFIAMNNARPQDIDKVTAGHARVLRARLEDAMFFYRKDLQTPLSRRVDHLQGVLFQADLGTMYEKMERIRALGRYLADDPAIPGPTPTDLAETVARAATLCKADLVTQVVDEFPKLQGTMGQVYALAEGESEAVARAIAEHYRPVASGADLPESLAGSLLAVADKMDTICGCFAVGLIPSGTADPYALRRQGIGVIQILLDQALMIALPALIEKALQPFEGLPGFDKADLTARVHGFLAGRMAQLLIDEKIARDTVTAVLNVSADCVPDVWQRARSLFVMRSSPDFIPLAAAFKRVANIIKKSAAQGQGAVQPDVFEHSSEEALYTACNRVQAQVESDLAAGEYEQALRHIATLRESVDAFFDDVMVMAEDAALRRNRLALLQQVAALFSTLADFSAIATD